MQELSSRIVRIAAQELKESESNIINFTMAGLSISPCQDYLDQNKPQSIIDLFEVLQDYSKSDMGKRKRMEALNAQKQQNPPKPW